MKFSLCLIPALLIGCSRDGGGFAGTYRLDSTQNGGLAKRTTGMIIEEVESGWLCSHTFELREGVPVRSDDPRNSFPAHIRDGELTVNMIFGTITLRPSGDGLVGKTVGPGGEYPLRLTRVK